MTSKADPNATTPDVSASDEWEFEAVVNDSPTVVIFDTIGDQFVGMYKGMQRVEARTADREAYERFAFTGRDGGRYAIAKSRVLDELMRKVPMGTWVRITFVGEIPQSKGFNAMKDFTVEVKK